MARLTEISNLNGSQRGQAVLTEVYSRSKWLQLFNRKSGFTIETTSYQFRPTTGNSSAQSRAIGDGFVVRAERPDELQNDNLRMHGEAIEIDISHIEDARIKKYDLDDWVLKRMKKIGREFGRNYDSIIGLGDGQGTNMKGLSTLLDGTTLQGLGITGVIDAATWLSGSVSEFDFTDEANWRHFYKGLKAAIAEVPDGVIVANGNTCAYLDTYAQMHFIKGESRSEFGVSIPTFDNTERYEVPNQSMNDGDIIIARIGEGDLELATNSGFYYKEFDQQETKESNKEMFEIRANIKIESDDCVRRIRNIKIN